MIHIRFPPRNILIILLLQFFGMVLSGAAHLGTEPYTVSLMFFGGSILMVAAVLLWLILMTREFRAIMGEIQEGLKKAVGPRF